MRYQLQQLFDSKVSLITFLFVQIYLLIAIITTTDLDLFLGYSGKLAPFIDISIALFYICTPILLLVAQQRLIHLCHSPTSILIIIATPIAIQTLLFWRFIDYQNLFYSAIQLLCLYLSLMLCYRTFSQLKIVKYLVVIAFSVSTIAIISIGNTMISPSFVNQYRTLSFVIPKLTIHNQQLSECNNDPIDLSNRSYLFLEISNLKGCELNLSHSNLAYASFKNSAFKVNFENSTLIATSFNQVRFEQANFNAANLRLATFTDSNLVGVNLHAADLLNTTFNNNDMRNSELEGISNYYPAQFTGNKLDKCTIDKTAPFKNNHNFSRCELMSRVYTGVFPPRKEWIYPTKPNQQQKPRISKALNRIAAAKYRKLETLHLEGLDLTEIPKQIAQLTDIRYLYLNDNQLDSKQLEIIIDALPNLIELHFANNNLTTLPTNIHQLERLSFIDLNSNPLKQLPDELKLLSHLKYIDLRNTSLNHLPTVLGEMPEIGWLYLDDTSIEQLTSSVVNQPLRHLSLKNTPITIPPPSVIALAKQINSLKPLRDWFDENPQR